MPEVNKISKNSIEKLAARLGKSYDVAKAILMVNEFIDDALNINPEKRDQLFAEYPDLATGLESGKVTDRNKKEPAKVRIRANKYGELKELWEKLNQKYFIAYEKLDVDYLLNQILSIIKSGIYGENIITSLRDIIMGSDDGLMTVREEGVSFSIK